MTEQGLQSIFERETCVGCTQQAAMFITIGHYRLWMCEEHARQTQEGLGRLIPDPAEEEASYQNRA